MFLVLSLLFATGFTSKEGPEVNIDIKDIVNVKEISKKEMFPKSKNSDSEIIQERLNFPHEHNWVEGYCTVCTARCIHEWQDGKCMKCGMFCSHKAPHDKDTVICSICGSTGYHKYKDGICVGCGREPDFVEDWPDSIFLKECKHKGETYLHRVRIGETGWYKKISVHIPYGYTPEKKYNVMFMMAGLHCPYNQWTDLLMWDHGGIKTQDLYDNMFEYGLCEPCIVVSFSDSSLMGEIRETDERGGFDSLYSCEGNLVDGIIPFVIENYSTYAKGTSREDMVEAREHFGMGGFSNGGYNTYFTGLRCMGDVFANFAPFAGTIQPENVARSYNENFSEYHIDAFYAGCGKSDQENYKCLPAYEIMLEKVTQLEEGKNAWYGQPAGYHTWQAATELAYNAFQVMFPAK